MTTGYGRESQHTLESQFKTASILPTREIIAVDTEQVPVVSLEYFQQTLLPKPLAAAVSVLESRPNGLFTKNNQLHGFAQDPAASGKTEGGIACLLKNVFDQLVKLVKEQDKKALQTVQFIYEPNQPTTGTTNPSRPDGYLRRIYGEETLAQEQHSWEDIVSADEYKLHGTETDVCHCQE